MKRTRKGFTLLELLVVIAIMGIIGATGMIAGQEATSAAKATAIAENIDKLATAMMMFYSENSTEVDRTGQIGGEAVTAAILAAGVNAYLKQANEIGSAAAANTYFAAVGTEEGAAKTWWIGYQFGTSDGDVQAKRAMANKANRMGLVTEAGGTTKFTAASDVLYMKVR